MVQLLLPVSLQQIPAAPIAKRIGLAEYYKVCISTTLTTLEISAARRQAEAIPQTSFMDKMISSHDDKQWFGRLAERWHYSMYQQGDCEKLLGMLLKGT